MNKQFLYWVSVFGLSLVAIFLSWMEGLIDLILETDKSFISIALLITYPVFSGANAVYALKGGENIYRVVNFYHSNVFTVGLFGTIIGLIFMMDSNLGGDKEINDIIVNLKYGMSTALFTTLLAIFCGMFVKLQSFIIDLTTTREIRVK